MMKRQCLLPFMNSLVIVGPILPSNYLEGPITTLRTIGILLSSANFNNMARRSLLKLRFSSARCYSKECNKMVRLLLHGLFRFPIYRGCPIYPACLALEQVGLLECRRLCFHHLAFLVCQHCPFHFLPLLEASLIYHLVRCRHFHLDLNLLFHFQGLPPHRTTSRKKMRRKMKRQAMILLTNKQIIQSMLSRRKPMKMWKSMLAPKM
mmetsp:Transcript_2336/g.3221  ORF Transcript_2336/g.3221 Transcript_2336/m.3221 type:complete len:207 (-) Transcript_2336:730-1350(-)